jgi:hypothetical protein
LAKGFVVRRHSYFLVAVSFMESHLELEYWQSVRREKA